MTAIVMNTLTGAVSEYSGFEFQSITPTQAGSALGLFDLGGGLDGTDLIVADVRTPKTLLSTDKKKSVRSVYFALLAEGDFDLNIYTLTDEFSYSFTVRESGESRATPGRGIRENYLSIGMQNPGGEAFRLDKFDVLLNESDTRRI